MMEKIMAKKSFYKIEMLFLKVLEQEDCYGYQLTQSIQDITNGQIKIAEGTMYPILYNCLLYTSHTEQALC